MKDINIKKVLSTVALLLGAAIGAGFASGREIKTFFGQFGYFNIILLSVAFIGLMVYMYAYSRVGKIVKAKNVSDVTGGVFKKLAPVFNVLIPLSLFGSLFTMIAGLDSLAVTIFSGYSYSFPWFSIVISIFAIIIVSGGLKSILKISNVIVPTIIVSLLFATIVYIIGFAENSVEFTTASTLPQMGTGFLSSLFYIGGNTITGGIILTQLGSTFTKKESAVTSVLFSVFFIINAGLITLSMFVSTNLIFNSDMPMVSIASIISPVLGNFYSVIIFFGMTMTLIACAFALTKWFKSYFKSDFLIVASIIAIGYALSRFGFGPIMDVVYPAKGAVNFIYGAGVLAFFVKNRKKINDLSVVQTNEDNIVIMPQKEMQPVKVKVNKK